MAILTFQPHGQGVSATFLLPVSTTPVAFQPQSAASNQGVMLANMSTNHLYVSFGTNATSSATVTYPTSAAVGGLPILAGTKETFGFPPNGWLAALTSAGAAILAITPGYGQ